MKREYLFVVISMLFVLIAACDDGTVTDSTGDNGSNDNGGDPTFSYNHERSTGASATDFLRDDDFENLVVEIQFMDGYRPTDEALTNLQQFLEERLNKSSVTILSPVEISSGGQESYSASDVRELEREHRREFSEVGTLAAYFIILDGEFSESNVLGIAHYNTSMALFGETIQGVSDGVGQADRSVIERTVMKHEIGHILGLVNNGVEMQENHQDDENGNHCDVDSCLMYFAVRTTDFFANLFGGSVPELDEFCIADLQAAGGR